jgi:uncharacterized membrane protein
MTKYLIAYLATAIVFFAIDLVWLSRIATDFYQERLGSLLLDKPNMAAAAGFYLIYVIGIVVFAVQPGLKSGSVLTALTYGGLFGFFAYATYDMTNYATLKNWPFSVVAVDVAWGTVLTALSAALGTWLTILIAKA